jgi:hypothetical protein
MPGRLGRIRRSSKPIARRGFVVFPAFKFASEISVGTEGFYPGAVMADKPVAYYRMGESSGQPQDFSGNGNHTTTVTGTPAYSQPGAIADENGAIRFQGTTNNQFTAPDHPTLDVGDLFTVEAWIKLAATGQYHEIVNKGGGTFQLDVSDIGSIRLAEAGIAIICYSSVAITDTTTWHHIVATKDGVNFKIYLDNVDVTISAGGATCGSGTEALFIGNLYAGGFPANAFLDEIAVYPTYLSATRIAAHYAASSLSPLRTTIPAIDTGVGVDSGSVPALFFPKRRPRIYSDALHRKSRW